MSVLDYTPMQIETVGLVTERSLYRLGQGQAATEGPYAMQLQVEQADDTFGSTLVIGTSARMMIGWEDDSPECDMMKFLYIFTWAARIDRLPSVMNALIDVIGENTKIAVGRIARLNFVWNDNAFDWTYEPIPIAEDKSDLVTLEGAAIASVLSVVAKVLLEPGPAFRADLRALCDHHLALFEQLIPSQDWPTQFPTAETGGSDAIH